MDTGTFAADSVTKLLERLAFRIHHVRQNGDVEAVHDLRVAIRRFGQSLVLFKNVFAGKEVKKIRRRLKELMKLTNEARDCDVGIELLSESELAGAPSLVERLRKRRKEAMRLLVPELRRWSARKTSSKWRAALNPNGGSHLPLEETARTRLPKFVKRFLKDGDHSASADELHHVRIEGKKLRYSLELLEPVYGPAVTDWIEKVKNVQSLLGKANDCRAVRLLVTDVGGDDEVEAWLKKRQQKKTREFRKAWGTIADELRGMAGLLKDSPPPRKSVAHSAKPAKVALRA
jgi:CHAD domain-containing protein